MMTGILSLLWLALYFLRAEDIPAIANTGASTTLLGAVVVLLIRELMMTWRTGLISSAKRASGSAAAPHNSATFPLTAGSLTPDFWKSELKSAIENGMCSLEEEARNQTELLRQISLDLRRGEETDRNLNNAIVKLVTMAEIQMQAGMTAASQPSGTRKGHNG